MAIMYRTGIPLRTDQAPEGILSFEFAGSLDAAQLMLDSWKAMAMRYAGLNLAFDYPFMLSYGLFLASLTELVKRKARAGFLQNIGRLFVIGMLLAALLDAIENVALIRLYLGVESNGMAQLAYWCAGIKFGLILSGLAYILVAFVISLIGRKRSV